jgi:hypothetical protein
MMSVDFFFLLTRTHERVKRRERENPGDSNEHRKSARVPDTLNWGFFKLQLERSSRGMVSDRMGDLKYQPERKKIEGEKKEGKEKKSTTEKIGGRKQTVSKFAQ